jgi:hypothetical protein
VRTLERVTRLLSGDPLREAVLEEVSRGVESRLMENVNLSAELSEGVKRAVYSSMVFQDGLLITTQEISGEPTQNMDDLLYPLETLDNVEQHDTVATAVRGELDDLDNILSRVRGTGPNL